jgi:uncharacterized protein
MDVTIRNNEGRSRYEVLDGGAVIAVADYRIAGAHVVMPHTHVDPARRGQGLAAHLVRHALDDVRAAGRSVIPTCWYVSQFIDEHPEYEDLLAA